MAARNLSHSRSQKLGSVQQHLIGARNIIDGSMVQLGVADGTTTLPRATDQYCAILEVKPVNYLLFAPEEQEAIIAGYRSLINSVSFPLQILVRVTPLDLHPFLDQLRTRIETLQQMGTHDAPPLLAELTQDTMQFVQLLATRRRLLERHFYIVVPAAAPEEQQRGGAILAQLRQRLALLRRRSGTQQLTHALQQQALASGQLDLRINQIAKLLLKVGLESRRVRGLDLVRLYQSCLVPGHAHAAPLSAEQLAAIAQPTVARAPRSWAAHRRLRGATPLDAEEVPLEDTDSPAVEVPNLDDEHATNFLTLADLLAPSAAEILPNAVNLDGEFSRTLAVVGYPRHVYPGWLPHLIATDIPIDLAMYLQPIQAGGMIRKLTRQMAEYRSSELLDARQGRMADAERTVASQDVERLRDKLQRGEERIFALSLYITIRAPSLRALDDYTAQIRTTLDNLLLIAHSAVYEQDLGLLSCLPEARDRLKRHRLLDSSSVATTFPFASATISMPQGVLYGVASDGGLIILDPFSSELENANQVVFAKSGAGKSYACKLQALRLLMLGYSVYVIDPESEWRIPCRAAGGVTIRLAAGSAQHINPFDLPAQHADATGDPDDHDQRDLLKEHIRTVMSLMDLLLADTIQGSSAALSQREKSYLERAIAETYRQAGISADTRTHTTPAPLLRDLFMVITAGSVGKDVFHLAERLQRYVSGSLSELFAGPTNVALDNPFVVFDIRDMDIELRPIGLFLIANFVWTRTRREQSRQPRLLYIDEAWTLMQFKEGGRFLSDIARRARKYYLGLCTITQDVEDFLNNEFGRTVLSNSSIKLLMKQDSTTIAPVTEAFRLSQGERQFVLGCNKGEGLLFARGAHVALMVERSEREHQLATTNPRERAASAAPEPTDDAVARARRPPDPAHRTRRGAPGGGWRAAPVASPPSANGRYPIEP